MIEELRSLVQEEFRRHSTPSHRRLVPMVRQIYAQRDSMAFDVSVRLGERRFSVPRTVDLPLADPMQLRLHASMAVRSLVDGLNNLPV